MLGGDLTGLRRIDQDLYHEVSGKDEPSQWIRVVPQLDILLSDIRMTSGGCYDRLAEDARERTVPSRRITATGTLEKRSIYVTDPDGAESAKPFDKISVILHRAGDDFEKDCTKKTHRDLNTEILPAGRLFRCGGIYCFSKMSQLEGSVHPQIETLVPASVFDFAWEHLASNNVTHADLSVYVEVFQERLESELAEHWHHQELLIERDSADHPV